MLDFGMMSKQSGSSQSDYMVGLFKAISNVEDLDTFFGCRSVQIMIDYKWLSMKKYIIMWVFAPFLVYFFTFIAYSNVLNG